LKLKKHPGRRGTALLLSFLILLWLGGKPAHSTSAQTRGILVAAAISLSEAFNEIGRLYHDRTGGTVTFSFASSGELEKQIEAGAPADVFASAGEKEMDQLQAKQLIDQSTRANFARNTLVLVVPAGSKAALHSFAELQEPSVQRIAIGDPKTVPAGQYAQQLLRNMQLWPKVQSRLVLAQNVRQVLDYVVREEVDAGIVYATDAKIAKGKATVVATAPDQDYGPVLYPIAVVKDTGNAQAAKVFLNLVRSPDGVRILAKYGFLAPK
jgi:molybdate transport system substrate-binding protein